MKRSLTCHLSPVIGRSCKAFTGSGGAMRVFCATVFVFAVLSLWSSTSYGESNAYSEVYRVFCRPLGVGTPGHSGCQTYWINRFYNDMSKSSSLSACKSSCDTMHPIVPANMACRNLCDYQRNPIDAP